MVAKEVHEVKFRCLDCGIEVDVRQETNLQGNVVYYVGSCGCWCNGCYMSRREGGVYAGSKKKKKSVMKLRKKEIQKNVTEKFINSGKY